jgi:hypothetical protein
LDILEETVLKCRAKYGYRPLDMVLPATCVRTDLDCMRPDTWERIYCSQLVLLFLRRCVLSGILGGADAGMLWSVNSHGCSPARLRALLGSAFT